MKKWIVFNKVPLLLTAILFILSVIPDDYTNPFQKPISGDAHGYYAYLPAIFIYQDLSFSFIDEVYEKHYTGKENKSFIVSQDDYRVNKTFPGIALLYLPFFLLAHIFSFLFGMEADGYSILYQYAFVVAQFTYLFFGLSAVRKLLLAFSFKESHVDWSLVLVVLGTNLFFYSVMDHSVTHVYSFGLINLALWSLYLFKRDRKFMYGFAFLLLVSLLGIIRPTNIVVILLFFFFFPDFKLFISLVQTLFQRNNWWKTLIGIGLIFFIPLLLWKIQTNHWLVYSYGEEGFDFRHPHMFEFLFSYVKGWWLYTPIAAVIILGASVVLFRQDRTRFWFLWLLLSVVIYVSSSWWCWYYGAGMSQRVMIDFYAILVFLLTLLFKHLEDKNVMRYVLVILCILALAINITQAYQIKRGVFTFGSATKEQYWDNFLQFNNPPKVYPFAHWEIKEKMSVSLANEAPFIVKGKSLIAGKDTIISVTPWDHFSATLKIPLQEVQYGSRIAIAFDARARTENATTKLLLFDGTNFHKPVRSITIGEELVLHDWVQLEYLFEPDEEWSGPLYIYFWNAGRKEKVEVKNISITHYYSAEYF
jgi:hypothetical protein